MMSTSQYRVKDGVEAVDGRPVPESRIVTLTPEAARYDLDAGKIEPADQGKGSDLPKSKVARPPVATEPAQEIINERL